MGTSRGLALTVTVGGIGGGASRGESRDTTLLPPTDCGIDGNLGKGTYAGEICGVTLSLVACG
jgi:hypothetical protein